MPAPFLTVAAAYAALLDVDGSPAGPLPPRRTCTTPACPGVVIDSIEGVAEVQCCDVCARFAVDEDAARYVRALLVVVAGLPTLEGV